MKRIVPLLLLSMTLPAGAVDSADRVLSEVKAMGLLNGQALACSRPESVARIKALMIKLTPKSRLYGTAFETATNESFLAQTGNEPAACRDAALLSELVEDEAKRLQAALADAVPK
ncbi:MAG: hypothetical protein HY799_10520 [Nitrosomonadales bacterium]|nr:hypothetical protein [Nitrosomonadales bacterium]